MSSRILHPDLLTANLLRFVLEEPGHSAGLPEGDGIELC
jgi:hypothetical protein